MPLPRARRRQNSQTATSSTRHSLVATLNTPPPSLTSTITATRPADQLDQAAAKATPEALRCLETMWRERRKVRLAEMRAEQGIGKSPRKMRAEEDVGRIGSPVARIVQKGALGNAQTTRQTIPRYHSAKRQTNVRPTGMSKEGVSIARTGRAAGVRDFNENRGIRRRSLEQPPAMKAYELAEDTFRSKAHQRFADTLVKKVRCLPRIETTLERQRTETSNARKIKFDLLPTGRRRISKSATLAIQQEPAVSTSSILKVPTPPRRLTLSLAKETYHVHEDGREIIVEGGNDDSQRMKRIRLKDQGMWGMKDWNRWELVFGIVEKIKRHTERFTWNHPSGCLHLMCNSPSDIIYHHHASPLSTSTSPGSNERVERNFSAGITVSPSRGVMQISVRRRWLKSRSNAVEGSEALSAKRQIALPTANSVTRSIRILLERQLELRQHPFNFKEVTTAGSISEGDILWDSDELRALRSFLSCVSLLENDRSLLEIDRTWPEPPC